MKGTLIFVYNADEGLFASIGDAVHKAVSPATYPCSLCAVTYGAVRMRPKWRDHLRSLPYATSFFHRSDFRRAYPSTDVELPAILLDRGSGPQVVMDADALDRIGTVAELIAALDARLARV